MKSLKVNKLCSLFVILLLTSAHLISAESPTAGSELEVQFVPPAGWRFAEKQEELKSVQLIVVGKGSHEFPPSINLSTEKYTGTLKDYLKIVKSLNEKQGSQWKDLGSIQTEAGPASLSQIDMKTSWGEVREMHVILSKNQMIYILTAAALKEEFPKFYKDFFQAMRSLKINKTVVEIDSKSLVSNDKS